MYIAQKIAMSLSTDSMPTWTQLKILTPFLPVSFVCQVIYCMHIVTCKCLFFPTNIVPRTLPQPRATSFERKTIWSRAGCEAIKGAIIIYGGGLAPKRKGLGEQHFE